ncbi:MAG: tyrosine-type recombinase/integrase [Rhizobiaceae bacterium]
MPYAKVGALLKKLHKADAMAARALELCILCASRPGEVLNAVWSEFDLDDKLVWSIPAHRMKSGIPHTVPLSSQAVTLLKKLKETAQADIPFVFPGERPKKPLSNMAMSMMLRRMKQTGLTVHGFRASDAQVESRRIPLMLGL